MNGPELLIVVNGRHLGIRRYKAVPGVNDLIEVKDGQVRVEAVVWGLMDDDPVHLFCHWSRQDKSE